MDNTIKNYTTSYSTVPKVTISISRRTLWNNFIDAWKDMAWDEYTGTGTVSNIAAVLLNGEKLDQISVRKLFNDGYTYLLMGDAMKDLDSRNNQLNEIQITDDDYIDNVIVVHHYDINF